MDINAVDVKNSKGNRCWITYAPEGFPTSVNNRIRITVNPKLSFEKFFD